MLLQVLVNLELGQIYVLITRFKSIYNPYPVRNYHCRKYIDASNNEIIFEPQVVADIQREFNDDGFEKETSTHSAMVYHLLNVDDMVKVKFNKVCQYSYIDVS